MTELKDIINYVKDSWNDSCMGGDTISNEILLDCATRIYNSQSFKGKEQTSGKEVEKSELPKASEKQIAYLMQLGYEGNTNLNIQEAKELITSLKELRRKEKNEKRN